MKKPTFTKEQFDLIDRCTTTASLAGIEAVHIAKDLIRGVDIGQTVMLFDPFASAEVLEMPEIALTRIPTLRARLALVKQQENPTQEYTVSRDKVTNGDYIQSMLFTASRFKLDYRCGTPFMVAGPRKIKEQPAAILQLDDTDVQIINQSKSVVDTDVIHFTITPTSASLMFTDLNKDNLLHTCNNAPQPLDADNVGDFEQIAVRKGYALGALSTLIKHSDKTLLFSKGGLLTLSVNGILVILPPKA